MHGDRLRLDLTRFFEERVGHEVMKVWGKWRNALVVVSCKHVFRLNSQFSLLQASGKTFPRLLDKSLSFGLGKVR